MVIETDRLTSPKYVALGIEGELASKLVFTDYEFFDDCVPRELLEMRVEEVYMDSVYADSDAWYNNLRYCEDFLIILNMAFKDAVTIYTEFGDAYGGVKIVESKLVTRFATGYDVKCYRELRVNIRGREINLKSIEFADEESELNYCNLVAYFVSNLPLMMSLGVKVSSIIVSWIGFRCIVFLV